MKDQFDLFVIHVAEDARVALDLAVHFELQGYRTWCYELDSLPGFEYPDNIQRGIEDARFLLVLVSPRSIEKREEVTREVVIGQTGKKKFIPLALDLSDAEFEAALGTSRIWRQTFDKVVRVRIVRERLEEATTRITQGLKAADVAPRSAVDGPRVAALRQLVASLPDDPVPEPDDGEARSGWIAHWVRVRGRSIARWGAAAALAAVAAFAVWQWPAIGPAIRPAPGPVMELPAGMVTVWILDPEFVASGPDTLPNEPTQRFDAITLRGMLEERLLKITEACSTKVRVLNDDEIERQLTNAGCRDAHENKFRTPECAEQLVIDRLHLHVKAVPTLQTTDTGDRSLTIRIGRGAGAERNRKAPGDISTFSSLADWGAEEIALFMELPPERITQALGRRKQLNRALEDTFGAADPPDDGNRTGWLPSFSRDARAQPPPGGAEAEVKQVLEQLRAALQTAKAEKVAPLFSSMPEGQRESYQHYFDNVADLKVAFGPPEISMEGETARAAFLRRDDFQDKETGERTSLAVRLVAVLVKSDGGWKIRSLGKPS